MKRVLYIWKGFEFYSYSVMLYLGLLAGIFVGNLGAHISGLDPFGVFVTQIALIPFGILGARSLHAASYWSIYSKAMRRLFYFQEGGGDQFGAYAFTLIGSGFVLKIFGIHFLAFWDVNILALLILMLVTRFGCLLNGCCSGRFTQGAWGMKLTNFRGIECSRVPIQLLEAGWSAVVVISSFLIWPYLQVEGALFCIASAGYCIGRIILDGFREDCFPWLGPITVHQCLYSLVVVLCFFSLIAIY